jgi:hypothetical protein
MQSQNAPTLPSPPDLPQPPTPPASPGAGVVAAPNTGVTVSASASDVYQAFRAQRNELTRQLSTLEDKRLAIARRLREGEVQGADKLGLETRLTELDGQIAQLYKDLQVANQNVASAAAQPGAEVPSPLPMSRGGPPEEVLVMGFVLAMTFAVPLSIAWARRIWRRSPAGFSPAVAMPPEMDERLSRLEQAMDAVAVEVERIGEGQRFVTRVLGSGAAEPIAVPQRDELRVQR